MAEQVSTLREANNYVEIVGLLEEKNLTKETKTFYEGTAKEITKTFITGNLVIGVSDEEKYKVKFFANEFNSLGNPSKLYTGLETVMNEYISKAEALSKGLSEDTVTKVVVRGAKFGINDYYNAEKDTLYSTVEIRANFVNRVTKENEYVPKANFDLELYFQNIEPEKDENDVPTGRTKIEGIVPIYNGAVFPITLYSTLDTTYGDIGKYLLEHYETGKTGSIGGKIVCKAETNTTQIQGFGAPVERTFTNYKYEYIVERGLAEQYLITDPKNFDKSVVKAALLYREEQLEKKKNDATSNSNAPTNGFGNTTVSQKTRELNF